MSLRPKDPKPITTADLVPGDVLMSCGPSTDPLDSLIKLIDQGDYSHASLYTGINQDRNDKNFGKPMVVEATKEGIKYDPISIDLDAQDLVDAYRYVSPDGHRLGDPGWPAQPIIDRAMTFVGANYAYDELLLGAIVLLGATKSTDDPTLNALIRLGGMIITDAFTTWLDNVQKGGKVPMTCVEVVTTAFWQADPDKHKYAMQVQLVRSGGGVAPMLPQHAPSSADVDKVRANAAKVQAMLAKASPKYAAAAAKPAAPAAAPKMAGPTPPTPPPQLVDGPLLGLCTPRDMETSPTLRFVGCLQDKNAPGPR